MKAKHYSVNLNKASNRMDQFEQMQKRRKFISLLAFYVAMMVIAGAVGYRSYRTEQKIKDIRGEVEFIEKKIAELETSSDFLSPEDIFTLSEVASTRLVWSEKMSVLGNILPKDVAITELVFDDRLKVFLIKGISKVKPNLKDLDLVVSIIDVVKSNEDFSSDFSEIKFQSSQRIKQSDQEMVKFEIACLI
jgi:cell division protein FtsL